MSWPIRVQCHYFSKQVSSRAIQQVCNQHEKYILSFQIWATVVRCNILLISSLWFFLFLFCIFFWHSKHIEKTKAIPAVSGWSSDIWQLWCSVVWRLFRLYDYNNSQFWMIVTDFRDALKHACCLQQYFTLYNFGPKKCVNAVLCTLVQKKETQTNIVCGWWWGVVLGWVLAGPKYKKSSLDTRDQWRTTALFSPQCQIYGHTVQVVW